MNEGITFGGWLKQQRRESRVTLEDLAESIGCSRVALQKIELGERRPSGQLAQLLAIHLNIPPDEREAFIAFARTGRAALIPVETAPGETGMRAPWRNAYLHQTNLPALLTPVIGREQEVEAACAYLLNPKVRMLTLTGAPGIGKTRLALQVAAYMVERFEDGVFFVDLATVVDPDMVLPRVARTLGLKEAATPATPAMLVPVEPVLLDYVHERKMLLILDNFEQVLDAAGAIVKLMEASPWLKVLVTSREALRVRGERRLPVPSLGVPDLAVYKGTGLFSSASTSLTLATLGAYSSVELFVERAQAIFPEFELTRENAMDVAAICSALGGLPLAIELAAGRSGHFSPADIHDALKSSYDLLHTGARDVPMRQRTLKSTFEWSYRLLDPIEQRLFRQLSVFVQGCSLEAAEAVCNPAGDEGVKISEALMSLVDKSLLQRGSMGTTDAKPRFWMLEAIHRYAEDKLREGEESGAPAGEGQPHEVQATERAHARYFMKLAETAESQLKGAEQAEWLDLLELEHANLQAALRWAKRSALNASNTTSETERANTEASAAVEVWLRLSAALWLFWDMRGYWSEGREQLAVWVPPLPSSLVPLSEHLQPFRAKSLHGAGVLAMGQGDYAETRHALQESLAIRRRIGDKVGAASSLNNLAIVAHIQGEYREADTLFSENLNVCREIGDKAGVSSALNNLGVVAYVLGNYMEAYAFHTESLAIRRELGDKGGAAMSLNNLANLAGKQMDYVRARALYAESLSIKREIGSKDGIAMSLSNLGYVAKEQGAYADAHTLYAESLVIRQSIGDKFGSCMSLIGIGCLLLEQKETSGGTRVLSAVTMLLEAMNAHPELESRIMLEHGIESARMQLDEKAFEAAWAEGQSMTLGGAIEYALAIHSSER